MDSLNGPPGGTLTDFMTDLMRQKQTVVVAHRGGAWDADNSPNNFKASVLHNVEGVETDIWISKDGIAMVLHGDADGQLGLYGKPDAHVYDWTCEELKTLIKLPNGEEMPTLSEFLDIYKDSSALINIELKGPKTEELRKHYDFKAAAEIVHKIVLEYGLQQRVMVSSFHPMVMDCMRTCLKANRDFMLCRLISPYHPPEEGYTEGIDGVNIPM
jgi:glycerophosphoryl diester phosphodiesterase